MTTTFFYVGQRLNSFAGVDVTVEREASGGFGAVAMGPDRNFGGRWRALKILRPDLLASHSKEAQQRLRSLFLREALTWKGLWPHPNLLTAQFVTLINGQLMLVLDYAEQGSLRDIFQDARRHGGWITFRSALSLAQMIAAGLVALHTPDPSMLRDNPIIHRDLKPENVLIDQHNFAMITDFGLAKAVAEALAPTSDAAAAASSSASQPIAVTDGERLTLLGDAPTTDPVEGGRTQAYRTERGQALGTPAYMAPEQWVDASMADCPADAYAFGIILAELLTSRHPLLNLEQRHSLDEWRAAHATGRPIPLRKLGADVLTVERVALPDERTQTQLDTALIRLERLLARLLAKLPQARPSLQEALAELQQAARELDREPYTLPEAYPRTADRERIFWQGWANAFTRFGLHAEALRRIERAHALAPGDPSILTSYGTILAGLGRSDEAIIRYQEALKARLADDIRGRNITLNQLGNTLTKVEQYAEADQMFEAAEQLMPDAANTWYNHALNRGRWAEFEQRAGRQSAAREHAQRGLGFAEQAMRLNPDDPDIRNLIVWLQRLVSAH